MWRWGNGRKWVPLILSFYSLFLSYSGNESESKKNVSIGVGMMMMVIWWVMIKHHQSWRFFDIGVAEIRRGEEHDSKSYKVWVRMVKTGITCLTTCWECSCYGSDLFECDATLFHPPFNSSPPPKSIRDPSTRSPSIQDERGIETLTSFLTKETLWLKTHFGVFEALFNLDEV